MQAARLAARLLAQQHARRHELVDLGLQLELEQRDGLVARGVPRVVREVADAFERGPEIREVVAVELRQRIVAVEPLEQLALEIQRDVGLAVRFGDQELLVDLAAARSRARASSGSVIRKSLTA